MEEECEEGRDHDEGTKNVPRGPGANASLDLVTESSDQRGHETISELTGKHGETSLPSREFNNVLKVEDEIEEPAGGAEVVAEVTHGVSGHVALLEGVTLDMRGIDNDWGRFFKRSGRRHCALGL